MISKILSTISLSVLCVVMTVSVATAQTFNGSIVNTAGNSLIPSVGTGGCGVEPQTAATGGTKFNATVAGLTNQTLTSCTINLTHTWDGDLNFFLKSPNGQIIELSTGNGSLNDNYTNTVFIDAATTNITAGAAPFTGQFKPEGTLNAFTCGVTTTPTVTTMLGFTAAQNGTWQLLFFDNAGGDSGTMLSWALQFDAPCGFVQGSLPNIALSGTNPAVCGVTNQAFTAPTIATSCAAGTLVTVTVDGVLFGTVAPGATFNLSLSVGAHVIRYSIPNGSFLIQNVTVTDAVKPVINCPANITINLDPGACDAVYNYAVTATDNCPSNGPVATLNTITSGGNGNATGGMIFFDLVNTAAAPLVITGFKANITGATLIDIYTKSGTQNGFVGTAAAWTLSGQANATTGPFSGPFPGNGTLTNAPITSGSVVLPPNSTTGIALRTLTAASNYTNGNGANQTYTSGPLTLNAGSANNGLFIAGFAPRVFNGAVTYQTLVANPPIVQTAGLPSGATFPRGTTTNCFTATDAAGNTSSCCFNVVVLEYPNPVTTLVCNDLVYFSLDENCSGIVGADDILEGGPYGCYDDYIVELDKTAPFGNGPWVPAVAGPGDVGKTYQVRVTDPTTGNKCWGNIKFEDKLPPVLKCRDQIIPCNGTPVNEPAPAIVGAQYQEVKPNDPIGEPGSPTPDVQTYNFDYSYIPVGTPVLDVNVRIKLTGHTWLPDLDMVVIAPDGTTADIFTLTGCFGQEWPIDVKFDDQGTGNLTLCTQLNAGGAPLQCVVAPGVSGPTVLAAFNGKNAGGVWKVKISDTVAGDDGVVEIVGLEVTVNAPAVAPADACGPITLTYIDSEVPGTCATGYAKVVTRKWTAKDGSGNTTTCAQKISYKLPTLSDLVIPTDYDGIDAPFFLCTSNAYPTPQWIEGQGLQGFPYVFGEPVGCTINWNYEDLVIDVCDGTYKIRRKWTIIDWCIGDGFEANQIIKVVDNQGPSIAAPANITVSTDPFSCCSTTNLPDVIVSDNCSRINNISGMIIGFDQYTGEQIGMFNIGGSLTSFPGNNLWNPDTLAAFGWTPCLPVGTHTVVYIAEDDCGNTSSASFKLTVRDYVPPVAACDQYTVVGIGLDDPFDCYGPAGPNGTPAALDACSFGGVTWVKAKTFDDGSYDNCNNLKFTVRRMSPYSDCINGLNGTNGFAACDDIFPDFPSEFERATAEQDSIKFYCCEVGTTQTVILRVYQVDVNGNFSIGQDGTPIYNECMVNVEVQDKIKPACVPPANVTVSCENFDPSLWAYGKPNVYDNCCLDVTKVYQGQCGLTHTTNLSLFDTVCNKGTITRTFRAFDCHGLSSQCTQRVVVNYEQDYFVKFPNDVIVSVCDGTGSYGAPTFFGEDCELLGVSFEDQVFTVVPDACFKIERTWTIINWCTYNPNLGCINVPNPNPNPITNHPSNLPGVTVSPLGTPTPWNPTVVKINPTDATTTNYSIFYDANANCYKYKQIIKVIDTQDPTVTCPASPVEFCDVTPNDPQLWNNSYWWDNTISSHDLCEGDADLSITGTDACSGSNISFRYLLFLDLDGDGVMETVVSSTNLPGVNNVQFGNAGNVNYTGGQPRAFDGRPVPFNQQYRFGLDWTTSGTSATAKVRFDNLQSPIALPGTGNNVMQGVVPQLPYGTHKIKWFVADGCGNEKICEYTFVVKDCKKPTVVCLNGLSVNIMPTQMIQLWASDFLQYTQDNCTPAEQLKIAIRKSSDPTPGFPVDAQGNPITNVTFTCGELGTQLVKLWSIDKAGNADYCETYVIVQDNNGNCPSLNAAKVAGALATEATSGVQDGNVAITGSGNGIPSFTFTTMTNASGSYNFNAIPLASNSTVTPAKDDNPLNGVSTYDLVLISKHILGIEPLNSPYKMIAADANKSNSITTFDIVELRKLILGIYTELPNNTSWRFVDKSYAFPNANNPFQATFAENKSIVNLNSNLTSEDFVSVKVGDVNGNAIANAAMSSDDRSAGTLLFDVDNKSVKAGETFSVNFKAAEAVAGYQFTMNFPGLEVVDVTPGANMKSENFGVFANAITTSFDGANQGEFAVTFRAAKGGNLSELLSVSSQITKAEAYKNGERMDVAFRFNNNGASTIAGVGFELYQNQPNPFVNKTFIGFHLPEATTATLSIFDETGRLVYNQKGSFAKGYNSIAIDRALLNTVGVMYYKLETANNSATKKMIQTK